MQGKAETTRSDTSPYFARCSTGKGWYWVTWKDFEATVNGAVHSSGFAGSALDAEEQARASIRTGLGRDDAEQLQTYFASGVRRRLAVKERASRPASSATDAEQTEFVYSDYDSDYDGAWHSRKHRVVRKTARKVFVECRCDTWTEGDGQVFHDVKTFALDRAELESPEGVYSYQAREIFYTTPAEQRYTPGRPEYLAVLGLERGATCEVINAAYRRLATKVHPDHGGSAEEFKEVQRAYETAMSYGAGN